jgi:translation elongation factor EF-1beta
MEMKSKIIPLDDPRTNEDKLNEFLSTISKEQIVSIHIREDKFGLKAFIIYEDVYQEK